MSEETREPVLKRFADWLDAWHVVRITAALSHFALIVTLVAFAFDLYGRAEERQRFQQEKAEWQFGRKVAAWDLLTTKSSGNSGKITAIDTLLALDEKLVGLDLSCASNGGELQPRKTNMGNTVLVCNRGVYLSGLTIKGKGDDTGLEVLSYSNLAGINLNGAAFENTITIEAVADGASLLGFEAKNSIWEKVRFEQSYGAPFNEAGLPARLVIESNDRSSLVSFLGMTFREVSFQSSRIPAASFKGSSAVGINFKGADLRYTDFTGVAYQGVEIDEATAVRGMNISGAKMRFFCQRRNGNQQTCKEKLSQMWAWEDQPPDIDPRKDWELWKLCPASLRPEYAKANRVGQPEGC